VHGELKSGGNLGIAFALGAAGETPRYCRRDGGATFEILQPVRL
jgi:hypothetical protein